jgi:hypothetical protein
VDDPPAVPLDCYLCRQRATSHTAPLRLAAGSSPSMPACAGTPAALNINHLGGSAYSGDVLVVNSIFELKLDNVHDDHAGLIELTPV